MHAPHKMTDLFSCVLSCSQITTIVAERLTGTRTMKSLLWETVTKMYNTFEELDGTVLFSFFEANNPAYAQTCSEIIEDWFRCVSGNIIPKTRYTCSGFKHFRARPSKVPWHGPGHLEQPSVSVGEPTTPHNKVIKVDALRSALADDMFVLHTKYHSIPDVPAEAERCRRALYSQLFSFKEFYNPRTHHSSFSGKEGGGNDDLVMALMFVADIVKRRSFMNR